MNTIDPIASYAAFVIDGNEMHQFAIVSGATAADMLRRSTAPATLRFVQL